MTVIHWVSNGKNMVLVSKKHQSLDTDVRSWEVLIDLINKNGGPNEPYIISSMSKCTLEQEIIYTWVNNCKPYILPDFVQLLLFKYFHVETCIQSGNIVAQNSQSYRGGDCRALKETGKGNLC
jgi:hypothetical protein